MELPTKQLPRSPISKILWARWNLLMWYSPLSRGTRGVVLLSPRVWKGCHCLGTRDRYLMHYSNPFVNGGQKDTHIHSAHPSNDVQTLFCSSNGLNCLTLVMCVRLFCVEYLEKLMFTNGAVFFRRFWAVPQYFPKLFQSPFLSVFLSRKSCWSCHNHVNITKLNVVLFFWRNYWFVLN